MSTWHSTRSQKRLSNKIKRENARYRRKCGPVTTRFDPSIIKDK